MRTVFATLALLCCAVPAWALSCSEPRPGFWPSVGGPLPETPQIVLHTSGHNILETAWLEGPERVELEIVKHEDDQILRPKKPLKAGATYTLKGTGKGQLAAGILVWKGDKKVPVTWTVTKDDHSPATWKSPIKLGKQGAADEGWGVTSFQEMTLEYTSGTSVLAEVQMSRLGKTSTFYLSAPKDRPLRIGMGLCGGEIDLTGLGEWTAKVTLVGPSGARSETQTVKFASPANPRGLLGK